MTELAANYDVVCIGGAMMGSAAAYFLSENPDFDGTVLVVEPDWTYDRANTTRAQNSIREQFTIMTADAPLAYVLRGITNNKWINADTECESGCGIVPFDYQEHVYMHTLQWAIGLELFLMSKDPWRVILSTDHPNGGSFMNYPKLIKLLMDRGFRREEASRVNQKAIAKTALNDLDREYTLNEIAIITRAGPAKALGLKHKGHLGPGADADITIYDEMDDKEMMFNAPRYVFKSGKAIIADHEFVGDHTGKLLHITPEYDEKIEEVVQPFFENYYSIEFDNYAVSDSYLHDHEIVPTTNE